VPYLLRYRGLLVGSVVQSIWDSVAGRNRDEPKVMEQANQFLRWAECPYHERFMAWLYTEADKPVPINEQLIIGTARANTFKEIRAYLQDQKARANAALDREQHG